MNTGHDGSLSTLHANGPIEALERLETMMLMAGMDLPVKAIREYTEHALDLIVNIERMADGKRKVTSIAELDKIVDGEILLKEIFAFKQKGITEKGEVDGTYIKYNFVPKIYKKIKAKGITDLKDIFE
jgi:pilus assembly protein CpaF